MEKRVPKADLAKGRKGRAALHASFASRIISLYFNRQLGNSRRRRRRKSLSSIKAEEASSKLMSKFLILCIRLASYSSVAQRLRRRRVCKMHLLRTFVKAFDAQTLQALFEKQGKYIKINLGTKKLQRMEITQKVSLQYCERKQATCVCVQKRVKITL